MLYNSNAVANSLTLWSIHCLESPRPICNPSSFHNVLKTLTVFCRRNHVSHGQIYQHEKTPLLTYWVMISLVITSALSECWKVKIGGYMFRGFYEEKKRLKKNETYFFLIHKTSMNAYRFNSMIYAARMPKVNDPLCMRFDCVNICRSEQ